MAPESFHISEQELLLAADGDLPPRRMAKVREHLAACWTCRARMDEIETSIVEFVRLHQRNLNPHVPPSKASRALFQARLAELARNTPPSVWERMLAMCFTRRAAVSICAALVMTLGIATWRLQQQTLARELAAGQIANGMRPDPALTPGTTQRLTKAELCAISVEDSTPAVPQPVALRVFASYGIDDPRPRAYELDYLVSPELGGTNDIRNLWPQPYQVDRWNAHAKDALEDRLYGLVCEGELELATAQHDLAADWIAAYKKYFRTEEPLSIHAAFLKDRPWE